VCRPVGYDNEHIYLRYLGFGPRRLKEFERGWHNLGICWSFPKESPNWRSGNVSERSWKCLKMYMFPTKDTELAFLPWRERLQNQACRELVGCHGETVL